jgi:hypothetical protein
MKRIAYCCILSLLILLLLVGCQETKQQASADTVAITHAITTPEMTAAPTPTPREFDIDNLFPLPLPRNYAADNIIPPPTPHNYVTDDVIPTLTPSIFDVDNVSMQSTPKSSCFSEIGYDSDWEILVVRFRDSGAVYTYSDFPEDEWNKFIAASSLGRWYNAHIKGRYEDEKING